MTSSPESARPTTRRALRERMRSGSMTVDTAVQGAVVRPDVADAVQPPVHDGSGEKRDTRSAVQGRDPASAASDTDTVAVDVDEHAPEAEPESGLDSEHDLEHDPEHDPEFLRTRENPIVSAFAPGFSSEPELTVDFLREPEPEREPEPAMDDAAPSTAPSEFAALFEIEADPEVEADVDPAVDAEAALAAEAGATVAGSLEADAPTAWADEKRPPTALTWLDPRDVAAASAPRAANAPDLFAGARLTPGWRRPRVLVPIAIVAALCGAYAATTLMWPLNAVAPTVQSAEVVIDPAPAATATWPGTGSAGVAVQGIAPLASTTERDEIASITKIASVLMVLDELPLKVGEQGPSFEFTYSDARDYWSYRRSNQSSLDVPVGGSLTEYQMLQGILLGSANNYIDRLSRELWGSDRQFADAAEKWLSDRGISGVSLATPSGFDEDNVASPAGLIELGELAMKNPVFAEIVGTRSAEIPGVGTVTNTNKMLDDEGVIGVKTGTLSHWNLLTAKDVKVGDTTVRLFAAVLGQDSSKDRLAVTRELFAGVEKSLAEQPVSVPKGTVVGHVTTEWGDKVAIVTDADAKVVLWNGATAKSTTEFALGEKSAAGAKFGTLTADGPIDTAETTLSLADEVTAPSIWWRLTHPLELFGLSGD